MGITYKQYVSISNLIYRNDCTKTDYLRWEALGRNDILGKVLIVQTPGQETVYKIWKEPGTSRFYSKCPWLASSGLKNRYQCLIQDVKPDYCRQYPLTRKHALMTGCMGKFK